MNLIKKLIRLLNKYKESQSKERAHKPSKGHAAETQKKGDQKSKRVIQRA